MYKRQNLLREEGLNIVTLPKTIDNDIWGTDMTFGFHSAVEIATNAIDCIHTTAASHGRVFIVEVMGHKVGWLTLFAGMAGGADIILLPEIPYDVDKVIEAIDKRDKAGKRFTILAAVSYTHLDVYKRQEVKKVEVMGCMKLAKAKKTKIRKNSTPNWKYTSVPSPKSARICRGSS